MFINVIFISILLLISFIDYKSHRIENFIVLPAIALGIYLTGNWHYAAITYLLLTLFHYDEDLNKKGILKWGGGDVKLFTMIAAFMGWFVLPIVVLTLMFIKLYRATQYVFYASLPVAPFALMASLMFLLIK